MQMEAEALASHCCTSSCSRVLTCPGSRGPQDLGNLSVDGAQELQELRWRWRGRHLPERRRLYEHVERREQGGGAVALPQSLRSIVASATSSSAATARVRSSA